MAYHDVTGVLLVGGASSRFGSPKTVAVFEGEMLAERAYRILEDSFPNAIAVGKAEDMFPLSFEVLDDGSELRAAIVGVAAALRLADTEIAVAVPTDMPLLTPAALRLLADAAAGYDAAVPQTGPLPGAYRRAALPVLERRIAGSQLALRDALAELETHEVALNPELLRNVNTRGDLEELARSPG
ncbi:MAG: NTP transferase domain-containing protein [Actinomycetota bacterium]|nr:NTP transferase domain-containing protein [Actinomycetota bacterium]